ncbi:sugar transferase [bacterium]|nr:sugar transferase [bacterium]
MEIFSRFVALLFLFTTSPILLTVSFCCLIFQGSPIFFKQTRIGKDYKTFNIFKFRTMRKKTGNAITLKNDSRVTKFGAILRKFKIDEFPQLYNILLGDMRFIGPRPEIPKYFDKNSFKFLKVIKPGISDFSSIVLRDEEKILSNIGGDKPYEKLLPLKLSLANYYSTRKGFLLDTKLAITTIISLLFPKFAIKSMVNQELLRSIPELYEFLVKNRII